MNNNVAISEGERLFLEQVARLPRDDANAIMKHKWVGPGLVKCLPEPARSFALRLVAAPNNTVAVTDVLAWAATKPSGESALRQLRALRIAALDSSRTPPTVWVNQHFVSSVSTAILRDGAPDWATTAQSDPLDPDDVEVEEYCAEQWSRVISFVVACGDGMPVPPSPQTASLLDAAGVLKGGRLTSAGFQFLLKGTRAQIWALANACASSRSASGDHAGGSEALSIVTRLSFLLPDVPYDLTGATEGQARTLADLAELGLLLFQPARGRFFLSKTLVGALSPVGSVTPTGGDNGGNASAIAGIGCRGGLDSGRIIVEPNFRVYAFTGSSSHTALIALFADTVQRLPGLFVATISRDSARRAFNRGITAAQIAEFLRKNAHPSVACNPPIVPTTVADQLDLWEKELRRIDVDHATMFDGFVSPLQFTATVEHARKHGILLWSNERIQRVIVRQTGSQAIIEFLKTQPVK